MPTTPSIQIDHLTTIAEQAGREIILPAYQSGVSATDKADGSVVTETDLKCQQFLHQALAALDTDIGFLGEEMSQTEQLACLKQAGRFWCVDPLDGTTNFATNLPGFAVSIALIEDGEVSMACTHDPVRGETFTACRGQGAYLNGKAMRASEETSLEASVGYLDFKRLSPAMATHFACEKIFRSQRNIGSCALEWAWLAAGRGQFIIHGGEKVWDFAAGSLIATEAGCVAGNWLGESLFPAEKLSSPVLAACSTSVHEKLKLQLLS